MFDRLARAIFCSLATALVSLLMTASATAQYTFSIDIAGPTIGVPDSFSGTPITEGDILSGPYLGPPIGLPGPGPMPPPGLVFPPGAAGLGLTTLGPPPLEVDALSYGIDNGPFWYFSVDKFAVGLPGAGFPGAPFNVTTEGAASPPMEAAADVFWSTAAFGAAPAPPGANSLAIDGDGLVQGLPGVGLIEPNPPTLGFLSTGDNVDAINVDTMTANLGGPIYFSLDSAFGDPLKGIANTGSAVAQGAGFVGGDILVTAIPGAGAPTVYATAAMLGLDVSSGVLAPDTDDLDAVMILEGGGSALAYDHASDFLLFSVRRGSALIGTLDALLGIPIEEGDILAPPPIGALFGTLPSIVVPAESLGLATVRSGIIAGLVFGDDLDALDQFQHPSQLQFVPEPNSLLLAGLGIFGLAFFRHRRRRA